MSDGTGADDRQAVEILIIEDSPSDVRLLQTMLEEADARVAVRTASTLAEGLAAIGERAPDLVLLDIGLPDSVGLVTYETLRDRHREVPVVITSGQSDTEAAYEAVQLGAQDFLVKGEFMAGGLVRAVHYAISRAALQRTLEGEQQRQADLHDEFLAIIATALRQPLALVHERLMDVESNGTVAEDGARGIQEAIEGVRQLEVVVGEFLDPHDPETADGGVDPGSEPVSELVAAAVETTSSRALSKGVFVRTAIDGDLPRVWADRPRIIGVLGNLLHDAIRFTPPGREVQLLAKARGDLVTISVRNALPLEGAGALSDGLDEASFQELSRRGVGPALYLCREVIGQHRGRIWVQAEATGSTVSFALPVFDVRRVATSVFERALEEGVGVALVSVEFRHASVAATRSLALGQGSRFLELVRGCTHPRDDRVIPSPSPLRDIDIINVFMAADEDGAAAFTRRLEDQLEAVVDIEGLDVDWTVDREILAVAVAEHDRDAFVRELESRLGQSEPVAIP